MNAFATPMTILLPALPSSLNSEPRTLSLDPSTITILRLGILAPITPEVELTLSELAGMIDGPFMAPLVQSWREAFRSIPDKHNIELVQFDMHCDGDRHRPSQIVRLLQQVSSVLWLKAKKILGREIELEVVGCANVAQTQWLQASLPDDKQRVKENKRAKESSAQDPSGPGRKVSPAVLSQDDQRMLKANGDDNQ